MRREERVTVQGPAKKQNPDGMSHRGVVMVICRWHHYWLGRVGPWLLVHAVSRHLQWEHHRGVLPEPCAHRARTVRAPCVLLRILCMKNPGMPVWTARCRNQDPGCVSMGAIQRGTSWATIPKTLNRARTVHAPCAHRARTVRQRPLDVVFWRETAGSSDRRKRHGTCVATSRWTGWNSNGSSV